METIGRLRPVTSLGSAAQPQLTSDPIDPFPAVLAATVMQFRMQPGRPVSTLLMDFTDLLELASHLLWLEHSGSLAAPVSHKNHSG